MDVCWTFAGSCKHPISKTVLISDDRYRNADAVTTLYYAAVLSAALNALTVSLSVRLGY